MRQRVVRVGLTVVVLAAGCDVPTALPNWDMTWNFPASGSSIPVSSILPNGVTLTQNGAAFQAAIPPITITRTLAQDCPQCTAGVAAPKPAYTAAATAGPVNLPAGVTAATLVGDTVFVTMVNRYQFDPINPGAGAAGTMIFTVSSGSAVLGTLTLSGPARTIPGNGATTTAKVPVSGTVSSAGISLRVDVTSPQGSTMTLGNTSGQQFTFTAHTGTTAQGPIAASSADLSLTNQAVRPSPTDFSVDLGSGDRADSAQVFLTFANPFSVSGTVNVNFLGCVDANGNFLDSCPTFSTVISRAVPVAAGTTTATLKFGPPGAKALLNAKRIAFGGSVSGATPVTPAQSVSVTARVQVTMHTRSP